MGRIADCGLLITGAIALTVAAVVADSSQSAASDQTMAAIRATEAPANASGLTLDLSKMVQRRETAVGPATLPGAPRGRALGPAPLPGNPGGRGTAPRHADSSSVASSIHTESARFPSTN